MNAYLPVTGFRWILLMCLVVLNQCRPSDTTYVRVFAASSLTDAFYDLERAFEQSYPGTDVVLVTSGSQVLRLQIEQGARADVFASANLQHMRALLDAKRVQPSQIFAVNELVVIVPHKNPAQIHTFYDLPRASRVVIGTKQVPVGRYTRKLLQQAALQIGAHFEKDVIRNVVSEESNVRLVRAKVELGEADAAVVYRTDSVGADRIERIRIPPEINVRARYPIAVTTDCWACEAAALWQRFLLSPQGQSILRQHGFLLK